MRVLFVCSVLVFVLSGCAGVDQLKKTLHDGIDIPFNVYDDVKGVYEAGKKLVMPADPSKVAP